MANPTVITPASNNGYGAIEFTLDGTDISGDYTTTTNLEYANIVKQFNYKVTMTAFKNMVGTDMYSIDMEVTDGNGYRTCRHTDRVKNSKLTICGGNFDTTDGMINFWNEVAKQ